MLLTIGLLALLGFSRAIPVEDAVAEVKTDVSTRNTAIEQAILGIIENLREIMINGSADGSIPVLDPLSLGDAYLDSTIFESIGLVDSHIEAKGTIVNGVSTFIIDDFSFSLTNIILQRYTIIMDAHIPAIDITADLYDMSVTALGVHVFGAGELRMRAINPRLRANIVVGVSIFGGISLRIIGADIRLNIGGFESGLTGLFNDDYLNDFINLFLGELIPQLLDHFEDDISEVINRIVLEVGNQILDNINIGDLLPNAREIEEMLSVNQHVAGNVVSPNL